MDEPRERRRERRIACCLEATCETIEGSTPTLVSCHACVRNISRYGANMTISRQFSRGCTLFLKLADPSRIFWCGRSARVIHANALFTDLLLGCEFTAPLTNSELQILLGIRPAPDRRLKPRFIPSPEILEHLEVSLVGHDLPVFLRNISVSGICLTAYQPLAAKNELHVRLVNTVTKTDRVLSLRLLHARQAKKKWCLGGEFVENLANQDLLLLLS
jgi:hypothetical protein